MGYASYILPDGREAGYAVQARCDGPDCTTKIFRGMDALCGEHPEGYRKEEEPGCGRYFCPNHAEDHDCPRPQCGHYPHDMGEPCALRVGHELPHTDMTGQNFYVTEADLEFEDPDPAA